ncbi:DUF4347 domain-containing protein [Phormidesmis priestleyi ULC007]|uniref:DUF4347 domain-containing protein n=1 Tax=Phormidesmis priestleyi ULC007 TaxID=1920490 RepID=A0A2T1D508_9CYAN|nr:Calx-beta domain-containing protein [Phormidesmis priestleyi]PSB15514.1 DUF4347 domain-containing protein [Phormidesmis priestleyi ULC007]PZO46387.1 MAG: DUF4347 domain-containing protein [Phormidesmis priestleyi]
MEFAGSSASNRYVLSSDAAVSALPAVGDPLANLLPTLALQTRAATSLLFIDSNVSDYQSLVAGVTSGTEVHVLDPIADAVTQITQTLLGRTGISSIHIISHGETGGLQLGTTELDATSLDRYTSQLGSWSQALTEDADILLYGCNVAQGEQGRNFVQRLGQITGADIAASIDQTGDREAGGNWALEVHTGNIATGLVFQASTLANYDHLLPVDLLSPIDPSLLSTSDSTGGTLGSSSVSNDGRYIVFTSNSGSLVADDKNGKSDVFWLDRQTQTLKLVSHNAGKTGSANGASSNAVISGDGLSVVFVSDAADIASGDQNTRKDVFLWKWNSTTSTDTIRLVSATNSPTNNGTASQDEDSYNPVISENGQYVAFLSNATNLTSFPADNAGNNQPDVFQWDGSAGSNAVTLVSRNRNKSGSGNKGVSTGFSMSRDGNYVAFSSNATNLPLAGSDPNGSTEDVFRWSRANDTMTVISTSLTPGVGGANDVSINPVISNDGSRIAFVSAATNLVADGIDNNNTQDIFLWDSASTTANKISLISFNSTRTNSSNSLENPFADSGSLNPVISGDGKYVTFTSYSTNLVNAIDANGKQDVFVREIDALTTFLVSGNTAGVFGNDGSSDPSISGDGKRISFASSASNLVADDTNGKRDVFVRDLTANTTSLVSRSVDAIGNNDSPADDPASLAVSPSVISADGAFVAFTSQASNLVDRDGNSAADVFIALLPSVAQPIGTISLVSRQSNDPALMPKTGSEDSTLTAGNAVSADGRYVVYTSKAPELASNDANGAQDVFIRDNQTKTVTLISRNLAKVSGNGNSFNPVISRDGQFVVFVSDASDLVSGDTNGTSDLFLWERSQPDTLTLISKVNGGTTIGDRASINPTISGNGQYVVFTSLATNLVNGDGNAKQDVFVWERSSKTITLVSHANGNTNSSDGTSENASISDDGRLITFTSDGTNLATGATTGKQIFLWDRQTSGISLISQNSGGAIANADSNNAVVSSDGHYVAFTSSATNLFGTDNNASQDVFIRDLVKNTTMGVSVDSSGTYGTVTGGAPASGAFASSPVISSYGGKVYIAFTSTFNTLVATDNNNAQDVFVREIDINDPTKSRTILVSVDKDGTGSGTGTSTGGSFGGTGSFNPLIGQDGRFVAFVSYSNNLVASDTNSAQDIFVRDLLLNKTTLISNNSAGTDSGKGASQVPVISDSGGYIAFMSDAGDLVTGDFNNKFDVFGQELLPLVSLTTIDATANEATPSNDPSTYQIKRSTTTGELTVKLAIDPTSTASSSDYDWSVDSAFATIVSFSATEIILKFLAGANTIDLKLTPKDDATAEADETLKLFITADATNLGYAISTSDNTATSTILANDTVVTNTSDSGEGSLRQAIINANAFAGANTISFAIPGTGVQTIALQSALPVISDVVTIDGATQTGFTNTPLIVLDGTAAGTTASGLHLTAGGSTIKGLAIENFAQDGILIDTQGGNTIRQNDLSANKGSGVAIVGTVTGNRIESNTFTGNTGLGIDLGKDGVTANDAGDLDVGANNLQNFPVLTIAELVGTGAAIAGTLNSTPGTQFRVEFFSNDATGTAQGKTFLGFTDVTTAADGTGNFSFTASGGALGQLITATATDASSNTSELSQARAIATPTVSLSAAPITLLEGTGATPTAFPFVVTLSQPSTQDVIVTYSTADGTATSLDSDYVPASTASVTFAPGQTSQTLAVGVTADSKFEPDETFTVTLNGATNATLTTAVNATGTIQNDDSRPTIAIADISQAEGDSGSQPLIFTASLSNLSTETVIVDYATTNNTATLVDNDYADTTGKLTFAPGQLTQTFGVLVNGDPKFENNETFKVTLGNPINGTIAPATSVATGTILNDDPGPTLSITTPASQLEGTSGANTPYQFVVNLSQASSEEITVDYATIDNTATIADNDYTAATGTLTFAPNTTSQTITVFSQGDTKFETDEQFFVKLTNAKNANLSATEQATGIITSDDTAPTIQIANAEALEGNSGTTPSSFVVTLSDASYQTITVNYSTADQSATIADQDYQATTGSLTFAPNETRKTITVLGTGDDKYEGNEAFLVNLNTPQNATLSTSSATGTITNDDLIPLISINDVSNLEGNQSTTKTNLFTISLSNPTDQTVTVDFATADGTIINNAATKANNDYISALGTVTFNPNEISKTITVITNGDANLEKDEDFFVNLSNATQAGILKNQGKGTIANDDTAPTLKIDSVSQKEGDQNTTELIFTVSLSATSSDPITVEYLTQDDKATIADLDYQTKTGTLTFAPNTLTQTFAVLANGDSKLEGDETFNVKLQNPSTGALISATEGIGIGTIKNDDLQPTIGIDQKISITEGTSGTFTVSLSNPSVEIVTVNYGTADNKATLADSDYIQASGTLTFNPGELNKTITISSKGDTKFEGDEDFTVNLSQAGNADVSAVSGKGTVTIVNDDSRPTVSIDNVSQQEGQSGTTPYVFTANLSNSSSETITVNYATGNGSATTTDNDYASAAGIITFNPNDLSQKITILANGDSTFEPDENFFVNLDPAIVTNATISAAAGVGKGTLLNDDNPPRPTIRIDSGVTQNEGNKGATAAYVFNVILSTITPETVTVGYTTKDNSATTLDNDYITQAGILTFAPNTLNQKITVLATGDDTLEPDESFFIDLQNPSSNADISAVDGRGTATLTNEDKRPTLNIDSPTKREGLSNETTPIEFVVTLSNPSSQTVTVDYGTGNGSATIVDNDFTQTSGKLTFNPGELKKTITVSANGDNKLESDETFIVQLTKANNADITGAGEGTGTLLNDDFTPTISLTANVGQLENATSPNLFVVNLSNPTDKTVTVNYDTSDGNATIADNDYSRATGTLTFLPTETSKTISVSAIGDTKYESNETFNVNLNNVSNATLPTNTITGTIVDDDPIPTISLATVTANQPEGKNSTTPYVFTATLTNASSQPITVDYDTTNGTATLADNDYLQAAGKLTFAPTETSKTFTILANGDTKYEDNETFSVSLSNAAIGSTISTTNRSVVATIANDDTRPTISLIPNTISQLEGPGGATPYVFTVALSEASSETITVNYSTADGTATTAGNDYRAISGKLTFSPGETSQNLTVNAIGDTRFEKDETFQLNVTNPMNATLTTAISATSTIANDDKDLGIMGDSGILWRNQQTGDPLLWQINSTTFAGSSQLPTQAATWQIQGKGDFNGDGGLDILWRDAATGEINLWLMNGTDFGSIVTAPNLPRVPDLSWKVEGIADFTGDGKLDLLWRNYQTGEIATWNLNGTTFVDVSYLLPVTDLSWQIKGIGDFNGDRKVDLLWRNDQTGEDAFWLLDGAKFSSVVYLPTVSGSSWGIEGIGDFNNDGSLDLLWRNKTTHEIGTWQLNRTTYTTSSLFSTSLDSTWQVQKIGDFNRDNNLDILWHNTQSGENKLWYLNGTTYGTSLTLPTRSDRNWLISDIGDFNRDGNLDLLWHNARSGETDIWKLNSSPYAGEVSLPKVTDLGWRIQATGDFNRDGSVDILWRNYRDGSVAFWQMDGTTFNVPVYLPPVYDPAWNIEGVGDFDRDGFLDLFWYNNGTGEAAIWTLNGMTVKEGIFLPTPGLSWQMQAIQDFDQDGNLDILWRSQAGEVAFWKMRGTTLESGTYLPSVPDSNWQIQGVGDFNGDGKPDIFWRNYSTGENAFWQLNGMKVEKALYLTPVTDLSWHIEGFRDYNGDGTLDILWRNHRTGQNALWFMNDATTIGLGIFLPRLIDPNWTVEGIDNFKSSEIE